MKKLLGIIVLGLLCCNVSVAEPFDKYQLICKQPMYAEDLISNGSLAKNFKMNFLIEKNKKIFKLDKKVKIKTIINEWRRKSFYSNSYSTNLLASVFNEEIPFGIDVKGAYISPKFSEVRYRLFFEDKEESELKEIPIMWLNIDKKKIKETPNKYVEKDILFFYHLSLSPYESPNFTFGFTSLIGKQYDQILDLKYKMQKLYEDPAKNKKKLDKLHNKMIGAFVKFKKKNEKTELGPLGYSAIGDFREIKCEGNLLDRLAEESRNTFGYNLRDF